MVLIISKCVTVFVAHVLTSPALALRTEPPRLLASSSTTLLGNADFAGGTYRARTTGRYMLQEDITFNPNGSHLSWSGFPEDSVQYPQRAGYFLGFFAAMTIEADDIEVDCNGYSFQMSASFHKRQRFFAHIELGSMPFITGVGPPQFTNPLNTPAGVLVPANNVTIRNCIFGLSSHHSIHGNENMGVTLENLRMFDFEVAGVALNGATKVRMKGLDIGPSLTTTFGAQLAHAVILDHLINTLMMQHPLLKGYAESTTIKLRNVSTTVATVLGILLEDLQLFIQDGTGPLESIFGQGTALPDGSAVYGIVLHRTGPAIEDFGFCPDECTAAHRVKDVVLKDILIHDLLVNVDQVTALAVDGKIIKGPAGDIVRVTETWDPSDCFKYVGNSLSDAQIALGVLRRAVSIPYSPISKDVVKFYFGSSHTPTNIAAWASGEWSCEETADWVQDLLSHNPKRMNKFICDGDAMRHINKGAVGLRLGFQEDVVVDNVTISNLGNTGTKNALPWCKLPGDYQGVDVRPVALARIYNMSKLEVRQDGTFMSTNRSRVFPVIGFYSRHGRQPEDNLNLNGAQVQS
mmetsp:Transcript_49224/g.140879  ORF Transcript_49224/g.140879 Transcript_49224/m.140879 type:complete len:576 (+) Transcript_49224:28-1755(+)